MPDQDSFLTLDQAAEPLFVGIDVGGTSIKFGLVDDNGNPLAYDTIPSRADGPPDDAARRMAEMVLSIINQVGAETSQVAYVGLASPGPLDLEAGQIVGAGNLPNWWNYPLRDEVSRQCGLPVTFANDANAAAYGEYWRGAGERHRSMILLTLGTGIGGGIIVDDLIIEGAHGSGSECGHILIDLREDARRDSLDKPGSLEAFCGAYSVVARAQEALAEHPESVLSTHQGKLTPLLIAQAAEQGDQLAREIIFETACYLGIGIVTLVHTIDPDGVVLGGAMTFGGAGHPLGEEFLATIRTEATRRMLAPLRGKVAIEFATLEGDAGFIGAAGMARLAHQRSR